MDPRQFDDAGIPVDYADYSHYPPYPQLHGPYEHAVSILDLLLNVGPDYARYMAPETRNRG